MHDEPACGLIEREGGRLMAQDLKLEPAALRDHEVQKATCPRKLRQARKLPFELAPEGLDSTRGAELGGLPHDLGRTERV